MSILKNKTILGGIDMAFKDYSLSRESNLIGEVKNIPGYTDKEFLKEMERLMEKHKVNYVQLYWNHFKET